MLRVPVYVAALILALFAVLRGSASAQQDVTAPRLIDIQFEPRVVDTSNGPKTITVTVRVVDDASGLQNGFAVFHRPGTMQAVEADFGPGYGSEPVAGDLRNGKYAVAVTLPQNSAYGEWRMAAVALEDKAGNRAHCSKPGLLWGDPSAMTCGIPFSEYSFRVGELPSSNELLPEPPSSGNRALFLPLIT